MDRRNGFRTAASRDPEEKWPPLPFPGHTCNLSWWRTSSGKSHCSRRHRKDPLVMQQIVFKGGTARDALRTAATPRRMSRRENPAGTYPEHGCHRAGRTGSSSISSCTRVLRTYRVLRAPTLLGNAPQALRGERDSQLALPDPHPHPPWRCPHAATEGAHEPVVLQRPLCDMGPDD